MWSLISNLNSVIMNTIGWVEMSKFWAINCLTFFLTFYIADQEMISFNFLNQYLNFRKLGQSFTIFAENRNLGQSIIYL